MQQALWLAGLISIAVVVTAQTELNTTSTETLTGQSDVVNVIFPDTFNIP